MKVDIQPCYRQITKNFLTTNFDSLNKSLNSYAHIVFGSGSQKSYITVDSKK